MRVAVMRVVVMAKEPRFDSVDIAEELIARFRSARPVDLSAPERTDFALYYEAVLGWYMPSHVLRCVGELTDSDIPVLLILWPPGHSKTTTLAALAAWLLGNNPNLRIIVATHTVDYSQRVLDLTTTLLTHPVSKRIFGDLIPPKSARTRWTQHQRTVKRSDYRLKDPSLLALGVGSSTIGTRADWILGDDLVTQANSMTATMRGHLSQWYWGSLEKRLDPGGLMRIFGARFYAQDLYGELISKGVKTIQLETTPQKPLWPERFPAERVAQFERDDYFSYMAQCRQRPIDLEASFLRESWLSYYIEPPPNLRIYQGVDPCILDDPKTDPLAIVTVGVDRNQTVYLLDILERQADLIAQCEIIRAQIEAWHPVLIEIESNAAQQLIAQKLLSTAALPIVQRSVSLPKALRFRNMATHFRNKKALLPAVVKAGGFVQPHPFKALPFVKEWRSFPGGRKNILDATEHALNVALRISVRAASATKQAPISLSPELQRAVLGSTGRRWRDVKEFDAVFH